MVHYSSVKENKRNYLDMKAIKQLEFKLDRKDYDKYGEHLPYAWVSFNPEDLEVYSSTVLVYYTVEDYYNQEGIVSFISDEMAEDIYLYKCKPLK